MRRRSFLKGTLAGLATREILPALGMEAFVPAPSRTILVGSCVVELEQGMQAGLDGVKTRVGEAAEKLRIAGPAVRQQYKEQMASTGLVVSSFMRGLLNANPLASDPRAPEWGSPSKTRSPPHRTSKSSSGSDITGVAPRRDCPG
jgi:hypothetical protein